jgi:hypothetical protein
VDDSIPSQQFVERAVSVAIAAADGFGAAGDLPDAALPLVAATRFLASETRQRWVSRFVRRAIERQR